MQSTAVSRTFDSQKRNPALKICDGSSLVICLLLAMKFIRIGILRDPDTAVWPVALKEYEAATRALKIQIQSLEVRSTNPDLERAFQIGVKKGANGVVMSATPLLSRYRKQIADLA